MTSKFLQKLEKGVVLGDGAIGTQLYARGIYINRNYDAVNLTDPHLVRAIHRDYIAAGAQVLETNTFGANAFKLGKHSLSEQLYQINKAGAEITRRVAEEQAGVLVAGSMGPLGSPIAPIGKISRKEALEAFTAQAKGLLDGQVDFFLLETFIDIEEIQVAIKAIRSLTTLPVAALMTIQHDHKTAYGKNIKQLAEVLDREPVEVIGFNCSTGPQTILEGIQELRKFTSKPLAAFPNAGEPQVIEGRILYLSTPEYFAEYTKRLIQHGVRFVGGCCGTTPQHIKFMASAIRALDPTFERSEPILKVTQTQTQKDAGKTPAKAECEPSTLCKLLEDKEFPVSCEINPPRSSDVTKVLKQVKLLEKAGVNVVNIPDGPRASARMSPMALAHIIMSETGVDTMLHYTCRDRNILGIQSDLLGAEALGLRNILCVTGDPPKLGDYPMATAVFDVDAIGLLSIADNLNHSLDLAGNPIQNPTTFYLGAGFNPGAIDLELEIERLNKKIEAGARFILTQPVFDLDKLLHALEKSGDISIPIMIGILPLASYRNAEFFHNEVPGMDVPDDIRKRMKSASEKSKEAGFEAGIAIAQEALKASLPFVQGAYIMPPFGKVELAIETVSILPGRKSLSQIETESNRQAKSA